MIRIDMRQARPNLHLGRIVFVLALAAHLCGCHTGRDRQTGEGRASSGDPAQQARGPERGWGETAGGLRMRLTAEPLKVQAGQPVRVTVELTSVSGRNLAVTVPTLLPVVSAPGNHPYDVDHGRNLVIHATPTSGQVIHVCWQKRQLQSPARQLCQLEPGGSLLLDVTLTRSESPAQLTQQVQQTDQRPIRRSASAAFAFMHCPGSYRLVATYEVTEPDGWRGTLVGAPVDVEVVARGE